ncbi:hypothetical protein Tco_0717281 [Tanacetum coccineum]
MCYLRSAQLINDMNTIGITMKKLQVNTKFVNNLQLEWSKFVTDVKLAKDMHKSSFNQLYAYLRQHEVHANEVRMMRERFPDLLALVANTYNTPPYEIQFRKYLLDRFPAQSVGQSCQKCSFEEVLVHQRLRKTLIVLAFIMYISLSIEHEVQFRRTSLTGFPAQSIRSSNAIALDSPYLLVLITGMSQSRLHESRKSPTKSLFDVGSKRISIVTVNTKECYSDVLEIITRIMRRTF